MLAKLTAEILVELGMVGVGIWAVAPNYFLRALPLLLLAALLVGRVALGPLDMTRPLEEAEIQAISTHIGSAERGRFGYGPHLAGFLEASWYWMTPRQQYRAALQIAYRLREAGVSSAILYGKQRQPVILMRHGNLIAPVAPR